MEGLAFFYSMEKQQLQIKRTAIYYTSGKPEAEEWWILLHGYAQRADELLEACKPLEDGNRFLIAPEGLSRFYREGFSGEIGASWMTKHEREAEINDYINYLNQLMDSLMEKHKPQRLHLMGFSQGTATATRWLAQAPHAVDHLIIYAGSPALEIHPKELLPKASHFCFLWGDHDKFIKAEQVEKLMLHWRSAGVQIEEIRFKGRHRVIPEALGLLQKSMQLKTQL